jgi:hypothetical protein
MAELQGICEIFTDNQNVVCKSSYCTITDSANGTMILSPESAGKLWITLNVEKKDLYIRLNAYGKVYTGKIVSIDTPLKMGKESSSRISFTVGDGLKELEK